MKKRNILLAFFIITAGVLSLSSVSALDISVEHYYPTPVEAGDYFNVWLKISNRGSSEVEEAVIKLEPRYPFSLESGEDEEIIIKNLAGGGSFVTKKMRVRVDSGAKEGENSLKLKHKEKAEIYWREVYVPITVTELQTSFDVVLQELNSEGVFIAIANIGKNPANAVTVSVPEQEHFRTRIISASVVGNLESGDYTLVNFEIQPKSGLDETLPSDDSEETFQSRRASMLEGGEEKELLVQIEYTDVLGTRRTISKTLMLDPALLNMIIQGSGELDMGMGFGRQGSSTQGVFGNKWMWVSIALLLIMIGGKVYRRVKRKKD